MRVVAAIGLGLYVVGAGLTWAADWVVVGAIVMIAGGACLFALVMLSASRDASRGGEAGLQATDEPKERLSAGWLRR